MTSQDDRSFGSHGNSNRYKNGLPSLFFLYKRASLLPWRKHEKSESTLGYPATGGGPFYSNYKKYTIYFKLQIYFKESNILNTQWRQTKSLLPQADVLRLRQIFCISLCFSAEGGKEI